ncbi:NUDIX domain-containing protein [Nonomuraea sp. NPDC047529]|uniref:NUDIX domain-containing protein n=1 Tax=Nonomuraea sp. NPDC047529 TaxID=3155623 RepID=UPI0034060A98
MGFDGFLVPDWAKPFVGYAVGMDWPEGDEDGCFRLADACAATAQDVLDGWGLADFTRLGDDWDGDALKEFVTRVRSVSDPALVKLIEQLVSAALRYNDLGVQVQYTKRMIEVSVWFLIFQIMWLLAATAGPWGPAAAAMVGARVQLTRLAIAQLAKRLLINIALFGGLMGGMDLAVQASQSRRDHLDWEQIMASAGTGALLGAFLTGFTGIVPARSMWGLMGRSGLASSAADLTTQLSSGQPLDLDRLLKSFTSGVLGGADAHWASWSPFAQGKPGPGPVGHPRPENSGPRVHGRADGDGTTLADAGARQDVSFRSEAGVDALINGSRSMERPGSSHAGDTTLSGHSPFQLLEYSGRPGDGYVNGNLWGRYGAAGVLIRGMDEQGQPRYLLMQQSQHVSNPGKWQLPGGALDSLERPVHAAARELSEELGVGQRYLDRLKLRGEHATEVGDTGWRYTNLAADGPMFTPRLDSFEVSGAKWFTLKELAAMANQGDLHPALARALPDLLARFHDDGGAPPAAHTGPGSGHPGLGQTIRRSGSGLYYTAPAPHVPLDAPFGSRFVSPTFGDVVWTGVRDDMSPAELDTARRFASGRHSLINRFLRMGDDAFQHFAEHEIPAERARTIEQVEMLTSLVQRQPVPETIDVIRMLTFHPDLFGVPIEELVGTVQREPGFLSTSLGDEAKYLGDVHLHLRVPAGTPAFFLKLISKIPDEEELLLGPGLPWFGEDVRLRRGEWHIYARVLTPEETGR